MSNTIEQSIECLSAGDKFLVSAQNWSEVFFEQYLGTAVCRQMIFFGGFILLTCILVYSGTYRKLIKWMSDHIGICSSAVWLLGAMIYIVAFNKEELNAMAVVPRAIIASFKMFVVTNELARVPASLQHDAIYMSIFSITHFTAALITFMFIFKMLGYRMRSTIKMKWHCRYSAKEKTVHLFWGVNDASCALAKDIRLNCYDDTIIMIDVDKGFDNDCQHKPTISSITNTITITDSEMALLDGIGALVDHCYNGPAHVDTANNKDIFGLLRLNTVCKILQKSKELNMYILSDDEAENIYAALNLQEDTHLNSLESTPNIFVHARRDSYNEVYAHYSRYTHTAGEKHKMKIEIVDSAFLSVQTLKQSDDTLPVSCVKVNTQTGTVDNPFNAMVIGFGATGQEAFKFLYEFAAFIGTDKKKTPFKCYAIDEKMDKIEGWLKTRMPAITEKGKDEEEELSLIKAPVDSIQYWDTIKESVDKLNYVVIALNNDTLGMTTAVNLFKHALRQRDGKSPLLKIVLRCYNSENGKRMMEVVRKLNESATGLNVEIKLFGLTKELFTYRNVVSDSTLKEAKAFHHIYENSLLPIEERWKISADEQWNRSFIKKEKDGEEIDVIDATMEKRGISRYHAIYDINRQISQNISNSLHCNTKLILMGIDTKDWARLKSYYNIVNTRALETTRYECDKESAELLYNMALVEHERWIASHKLMGYIHGEKTDYVKKHHECMCDFDKLSEAKQSYDFNVIDTTIKLAYKRSCVCFDK